jgi:hypothetical protein
LAEQLLHFSEQLREKGEGDSWFKQKELHPGMIMA